ncbi:anillin isoform X2 [Echeneis naucrates]|uniref:Anillin n=1 Tax=Echeneis naucrates TaxID=173247 RepID=A0A665VVX3_ECHNA|nr:anillin isoform X2 [Echeneis naucrates]
MDPFTEKLLERTRARRENLQKKMEDRQMVKRPREALADINSVISEPVNDKVPQVSSKPSPSKRRCSGENVQPAVVEENQEPIMTPQGVSMPIDPPTGMKPPVGPGSRHSSSLEKTSIWSTVQPQPGQLNIVQLEPETKTVPAPDHFSNKEAEMTPVSPVLQMAKEDWVEDKSPSSAGMKSRLQRLAQQRQCWDADDPSVEVKHCTPLSLLKRQAEVPPFAVPSASAETPLGRRGKLANLAATIGSWEDDLSHANIPKEDVKENRTKDVLKLAVRDAIVPAKTKPSANDSHRVASSLTSSKPAPTPKQPLNSPVKSTQVQPVTSPQKSNQGIIFTSSPQKNYNHGTACPSSPQKPSSSSTSMPHSPLRNQALSRGLNQTASSQKPELCAKPAIAGPTAPQEKASVGGPAVKSFLERFGERCQERANPAQVSKQTKTPIGGIIQDKTPTATLTVTPNTQLVQDRLRAAQAVNTTTSDLTRKEKMERDTELAQIHCGFQKGNNIWKNKVEETESQKNSKMKQKLEEPVQSGAAPCEPHDKPKAQSTEKTDTHTMLTPPASTSVALSGAACFADKPTDEKSEEAKVFTEKEINVDQSINSEVINELFDAVLEQSEDEEEDALNISSMSLLTPLAETVAAVVRSPKKRMMTSTPASSFIVKPPDNISNPSKFASADSIDASDEDQKLPYSIDSYRSTRVKETERPSVKQIIVRKEEVSNRAEEPQGTGPFAVKQRMKILTNEINLQQTVIHQASQALNCCTDEEHGKGSQVEAEAERLLLVAMERREALKAELDQLREGQAGQKKASSAPEPASMLASRGSITLHELRLPLKADFVCSTANKPDSTKHSFFIMIRAGAENTVATPLASTHRGLSGDTLTFPTKFTRSDVSSDFVIDIEVYGLVQKHEVYGDKKKKPSKSKAITPKRFLGITKSGQTPVVASPGGPNAVRTSNFVLVGSHKLTLSSIGKNKFPLEKVPFLCPLEGNIYLKLQCEVGSKVEERGFLTMFEDVSGFGAWHRRWCVLSGYYISYWTYPDDEKRKNPIGRINLANCTSQRVEPANREFCARPNTFELITVRPQREDDRETLVSQCQNTMCVTKNWLSADTKDERNLWMKKLNQIVVDMRMWKPEACYRPL